MAGSDRKIGHLSLCFVSKQSICEEIYQNFSVFQYLMNLPRGGVCKITNEKKD